MTRITTLAFAALLIAGPAVAGERAARIDGESCAVTEKVIAHLALNGEHLVDIGSPMTDGGDRVAMFSTNDQAFWTAVLVSPTGISCILARWDRLPREGDEQ